MNIFKIVAIILLISALGSCSKFVDEKGPDSDSLYQNTYCNDPEAVNYNWGFPGKPDNSLCYYPSEVFKGTYLFKDSIYYSTYKPAFHLNKEYTLMFININNTQVHLSGFCTAGGVIRLVADKYSKSVTDSMFIIQDTVKLPGQPLCGTSDTLIGIVNRASDTNKNLRINFTVYSDTGITYHIGTAIKQ